MDLQSLGGKYYFFDPAIFGKIFVFVDFGNVRPWAKELWPVENRYRHSIEVDIEKLAQLCGWVNPDKMFFYYGHYLKEFEHHKGSIYRIDKARQSGFMVKTKPIKMIPNYDEDGKYLGKLPKCNFDVEITMDVLTKIHKYDTVMIFSGDSDFGSLLQYVKNKGKKVVVVCTRNRLSKELQSVADKVIPAETLASFLAYKNKHSAVEAEV